MYRHSVRTRVLGVVALASALTSCHPYNQTYYTSAHRARYIEAGIHSPIVEFDDDGYLRAPWQLDSALAAMDSATTGANPRHPVVVLIFIHGWHNNASLDNENLQDFNKFAKSLQARLQSSSSTAKTTVLPIYFAWRGQNTWNPHWYNTWVVPFVAQYLTFFSRKATAERMGRGELEIALARISRKWHEWRKNPSSIVRQNFLVIAGHSFGGAALLTATLPQLVAELEDVRAHRARDKDDETAETPQNVLAPADLLIAVNPAIEASMLDRTVLANGAPFARDSARPQLLVLDADNDRPRSVWFKIGQSVGNLGHVKTPHSAAERAAVAKLDGQVKFALHRTTPVLAGDQKTCAIIPAKADSLRLVALDDRPCINSVMVVQTHQKIIDGHSGIWGEENREFLIRFVANQRERVLTNLR